MTWLRRLFPGIRERLLFSFSLMLASIAMFVVVFFPHRLERQAMRATVAKAEAIRDMAAYSATAGLLFSDTVAMHEVLAGVARNPDVQALVLRDASGRVVAAIGISGPTARISQQQLTSYGHLSQEIARDFAAWRATETG